MGQRRAAARKWKIEAGTAALPPPAIPDDPVEALIARARRSKVRGDTRRAVILLREACHLDEWRARTWTILGALLAETGRREEAAQAFLQARWLRARAGEKARAAVTGQLAAKQAA
jgi:Flp pilus assembly protein TadD